MSLQNLNRISRARSLSLSGRGRAIREAAHVSLRELAGELAVHPSTVARWEAGACRPRWAEALRWEAALARMERQTAEES